MVLIDDKNRRAALRFVHSILSGSAPTGMIRFIRVQILFWAVCSIAVAQNDSTRPIAELIGGSIRSDLTVSGSIALWRGTDGFENDPAGLSGLKKRRIVFEWTPGILIDINTFINADGKIREEMDGLIRDRGTEGSRVQYPSLSSAAGFQSNPSELLAAFPLRIGGRPFGISLGYSVPLSLDWHFTGTGLEAGIDSEQEIQGELKRVRMRVRSAMDGLVHLRMRRIQFGVGADPGKGTRIGFSVSRSGLDAEARVRANPDGIVEISGTEYLFNNPFDPRIDFKNGERNDISQSFDADYSGSGWGFRVNAEKDLSASFRIGLTADWSTSIRMNGTDSLVNNRIPFIRIEEGRSGGSVDDFIDPGKIDLASLTKTERVLKTNQYRPVIEFPDAFGMVMQWKKGKTAIALDFTKYSGAFSASSSGQKAGIRFSHGLGLDADFHFVFLCGSIDYGNTLQKNGKTGSAISIPRARLGFRIPLASSFRMEGTINAEPVPIFSVKGVYEF